MTPGAGTIETTCIPAADGASLAVHSLGQGRPLVLLHGLFSSAATNWIRFGAAAAVAAAGRRVIMPDLRGHGDSAKPVDPAAWPAGVLLADIEHVIAALGLDDYDLGGFSLGARLTVRLIERGARPRRAMLAGMGLEGLSEWSRRRRFFEEAAAAFDTAARGDRHWLAIQFMKTQKVDPAMARRLLASLQDDAMPDLAALTMPALLLCGEQDEDNGSAAALAERLPDGRFEAVPGTHMSSVTRPEFGAAIARWFGDAQSDDTAD